MTTISIETNNHYDLAIPSWKMVEDATAGQAAIKAKGELYLPKPNPDDTSDTNAKRYNQYLARAVYYNTCFKTLTGMVGVAFRVPPKITMPKSIEYIEDNVNGGGLSLSQQAQWTLSEVIKKGRCGLLVDYPMIQGGTSKADVQRGIRATIKEYSAEQIIDWNEENVSFGTELNYVKLCEEYTTLDIMTGKRETLKKYIVLRLIDQVYTVQHYDDAGVGLTEQITPTDAAGFAFSHIPFIFTGSENNSPDIDQALIYDLAVINVAHYRNSADNEESSFIAGQPTLAVTTSLSASDWTAQNPNGVMIGARKGHFLGDRGSLSMVQADANGLPRELMKDKEGQMLSLGAQLVSPNSNETAYATGVKMASNTSALALAVGNVSNAYVQCLIWVTAFMSKSEADNTDEIVYSINTDFFPANVDAATISAWVAGIQGNILPPSSLYAMLRDANVTTLTDEAIGEELENSANDLDLSAGTGGFNG